MTMPCQSKVKTRAWMKNPNIGHPPKYAFLAQMSVLIPSSLYELHCVPVTKMPCVRLPASHSSLWPTVEAIQLSGCFWFERVSVPTILGWAPVCHSWHWMSYIRLWAYCFGLAEGANLWRPLFIDNLHCCFGVQLQWATTWIRWRLRALHKTVIICIYVILSIVVYAQLCVMGTMQFQKSLMPIDSDWWGTRSWVKGNLLCLIQSDWDFNEVYQQGAARRQLPEQTKHWYCL